MLCFRKADNTEDIEVDPSTSKQARTEDPNPIGLVDIPIVTMAIAPASQLPVSAEEIPETIGDANVGPTTSMADVC